MPVISAMVDGEATPEQILELRPHLRNCPGCRATLKALHDSSTPLSAVLPIPLIVVAGGGGGEHVANAFMRAYEAVAGGFHERAVHSATKMQAALEAAAGGKVAAVAASAAAVAGGGYATVEHTVLKQHHDRPAKVAKQQPSQSRNASFSSRRTIAAPARAGSNQRPQPTPQVDEFGQSRPTSSTTQTEFGAPQQRTKSVRVISAAATSAPKPRPAAPASTSKVAPEFGSTGGRDEFGP